MSTFYLSGKELPEFMSEIRTMIKDCLDEALKTEQKKTFPKDEINQFLSRKEVCQITKVSLVTLHNWRKSGVLLPHKIGKRVLYKEDDVVLALKRIKS